MPDITHPESDADTSASSIDVVLENLDARLKKLEKPKKRTLLEKIQKNAAFLALLIGITLSIFSLVDALWTRPKDQLDRDIAEFNKTANTVAALRQSIVEAGMPPRTPQDAATISQMVMPQIVANIQYASVLMGRIGNHAGISQQVVLGNEAMNLHDWDSAKTMLDAATSQTGQPPYLLSEAYRYQGHLLFMTGKATEGTGAFAEALKTVANDKGPGADGIRAWITMDWAMFELFANNCAGAEGVAKQAMGFVSSTQVPDLQRNSLIANLKNSIGQLRSSCTVPIAFQGI